MYYLEKLDQREEMSATGISFCFTEKRGGVVSRRNQNIEQAEQLFSQGMPLVKIAEQLGVSPGTVRSWKSRYKWGEDTQSETNHATLQKKSATLRHGKQGNKMLDSESDPSFDFEETEAVLENSGLTEKQKLFCIHYIRSFNATKAYKKSHPDCSLDTAAVEGWRLLRNPKVVPYIKALKQSRLNREMISGSDIVQKYMDIAFADINDYVEIRRGCIKFLDSKDFDGTLVKKISKGKVDSIELPDRLQALKWLADHMDLATEKQRAEIDILQVRLREQSGSDTGEHNNAYKNMQSILDQITQVADEDIAD